MKKSSKNSLAREGLLKMAWKFLTFFGENRLEFIKKQDHRDLINDFDWAGKSKQPTCKNLRVWTKNEENFEKFQENCEIFWSKSLWKIDFFIDFLDFWLRSESIDLWKITPDFYSNLSDFGGGRSGRPPPPLPTPLWTYFAWS